MPQIALVAFRSGVPKVSIDPGDPGDKAIGLDGAKNRPMSPDRSDGSSGPDNVPPRATPRPTPALSHRRRRAPEWWRAPGRSWDRSSGCDPRRFETGAGRRRRFPHARRHQSSALPFHSRDRRRSACLRRQTRPADRHSVTPCTRSAPGKGPYSRTISAVDRFILPP